MSDFFGSIREGQLQVATLCSVPDQSLLFTVVPPFISFSFLTASSLVLASLSGLLSLPLSGWLSNSGLHSDESPEFSSYCSPILHYLI